MKTLIYGSCLAFVSCLVVAVTPASALQAGRVCTLTQVCAPSCNTNSCLLWPGPALRQESLHTNLQAIAGLHWGFATLKEDYL